MLDIKFIRENPDKIKKAAQSRSYEVDIEKLLQSDKQRRDLILKIDQAKAEQNKVSKQIKELPNSEKESVMRRMKELKQNLKSWEEELKRISQSLNAILRDIPNVPLDQVPVGKDGSENKVLRTVGSPTKFDFKPKDHVALGQSLDIIDVERAGKVSGSRFAYLKNEAVLLQFALVHWAMDILLKQGFSPMLPPVMVKGDTMDAMGFLQHGGADETYHFEKDDLYLVGTSEQSGLPYHRGEILAEQDLPWRYVCYSTCFRREAGSYGKDVRGILRVHQFDKLEMISIATSEKSRAEHEFLLSLEEKMLQDLKLPYRAVQLCTGDLNDSSATTIDLETWIPTQNQYRETHSASNCTDFQARRLNMRYKTKSGNEFCHTLNATAFAMGRTLIAILENYQQKDGSVEIPKVLRKYAGIKKIVPKGR